MRSDRRLGIVDEGTVGRYRYRFHASGRVEIEEPGTGWRSTKEIGPDLGLTSSQLEERLARCIAGELPPKLLLGAKTVTPAPAKPSRHELIRLIGGPYIAPDVERGDILWCEYSQQERVVGGYTEAPIPWPKVLRPGRPSLIVCGDLIRAVLLEAEIAIAEHWGVSETLVWYWRKALGVPRVTKGTGRLYQAYAPSKLTPDATERGQRAARSPRARQRMRESKQGRPAHPNTRAALTAAAKRPKSPEHRQKIAESNRRAAAERRARGEPHPTQKWTDADYARIFLRSATSTDREIAAELGIPLSTVRALRRKAGKRTLGEIAPRLHGLLAGATGRDIAEILDGIGVPDLACPHCGEDALARRGSRGGRYEHSCSSCGKWCTLDKPIERPYRVRREDLAALLSAVASGESLTAACRSAQLSPDVAWRVARDILNSNG